MKMCLCDVNRLKYLIKIYKFYKQFLWLAETHGLMTDENSLLDAKYTKFMEQLEKDISETNDNLAGK